MKIESYDFGKIVIDGQMYRSDVIVLPDAVRSGWWRKEGHRLSFQDLDDAVAANPDVLVVGTGYHGRMDVPDDLVAAFGERGIELLSFDTRSAIDIFNKIPDEKMAVAALHLTC